MLTPVTKVSALLTKMFRSVITVLGLMLGIGLAASSGAQGAAAGRPIQAMPAPLWRGVSQIVLVCGPEVEVALCDIIHAAARAHSPWPVGRSAAIPPDRATVILTIALEQGTVRRLVGEARRAVEIDEAEAPSRYAVGWAVGNPVLAVINTLLARVLPRRPGDGRRIE